MAIGATARIGPRESWSAEAPGVGRPPCQRQGPASDDWTRPQLRSRQAGSKGPRRGGPGWTGVGQSAKTPAAALAVSRQSRIRASIE